MFTQFFLGPRRDEASPNEKESDGKAAQFLRSRKWHEEKGGRKERKQDVYTKAQSTAQLVWHGIWYFGMKENVYLMLISSVYISAFKCVRLLFERWAMKNVYETIHLRYDNDRETHIQSINKASSPQKPKLSNHGWFISIFGTHGIFSHAFGLKVLVA